MKRLLLLLFLFEFAHGYEFTASVPRATQRTTENVLYQDFPVQDQANRTEKTLIEAQPTLDVKINTETENISDHSDGEKILLDLRRADPRFITPENVNLPLLPNNSSLRNPNLVK